MQIHSLIQGTPAWCEFRLEKNGASESAAMLGLSPKVKRNELLYMKHTGNAKEFSDWVQVNILDYGHEVEALARPHVEEIVGEDLYPVTCSVDRESASCDGLNMSETIAFEHKQFNKDLAASVMAGIIPDEHMPQCQQVLMVTGAEKLIFVVSDGTRENMVWMWVLPDHEWFERICAGWSQFNKDLADYVPPEVKPEAVGRTPENLPALRIEVTGMVTASNLVAYKEHALSVFSGISRDLKSDQDFADAAKIVKWCGDVEDRLAGAKQHALSQTESIDTLFRTIDDISAEARRTRLELEKLVDARKITLRTEIQNEAQAKAVLHIAGLNEEIGFNYIPTIPLDIAGAMKGKRTIASLQDAADTELAGFKIKADAIAKVIRFNMTTIKELAVDHMSLFADIAQIVLKANDDFTALIKVRINDHKEAEAKRLDAERAKMAEEARITAEANNAALIKAEAEKLAAEQAKQDKLRKDEADSLAREQEARAKAMNDATDVPVPVLAKQAPERLLNPSPVYQFPTKEVPANIEALPSGQPHASRPTDAQIIDVIASHFNVTIAMARDWVRDMDLFNSRPPIIMTAVKSSQIAAIGHDPETDTLSIQFTGKDGPGSVYHYKNIDVEKFEALKNAESIGIHFGKYIKNAADRHPFLKVG